MHLTGTAKQQACDAIEDESAYLVKGASFERDGVKIQFYCIDGRVLRSEYDNDYNERRIDEVRGCELAEFMFCHPNKN